MDSLCALSSLAPVYTSNLIVCACLPDLNGLVCTLWDSLILLGIPIPLLARLTSTDVNKQLHSWYLSPSNSWQFFKHELLIVPRENTTGTCALVKESRWASPLHWPVSDLYPLSTLLSLSTYYILSVVFHPLPILSLILTLHNWCKHSTTYFVAIYLASDIYSHCQVLTMARKVCRHASHYPLHYCAIAVSAEGWELEYEAIHKALYI